MIFDPFIRGNELAAGINPDELKADYILVSHGHEDHTGDLIYVAKQTSAKVLCNWEIHSWLNSNGVSNTHPMNIGGKWNFDFGVMKMVAAAHSSSLPDGSYGGNPAGFVVQNADDCFYYAGDTAMIMDMEFISKTYRLDFAFLPIGDNFTMDAEDASSAAKMLHCNKIIGMHYDTFGFIKIDHQQTMRIFNNKGIELILMEIGQTLDTTP
jgi:L-ascorbate metabolism protein UlaG (beta-lactamase superfamily)